MYQITNNATMYLKVYGRLFKVLEVCKSVEDANIVCAQNPTWGVLSESPQDSLVFICDINDKGIEV